MIPQTALEYAHTTGINKLTVIQKISQKHGQLHNIYYKVLIDLVWRVKQLPVAKSVY